LLGGSDTIFSSQLRKEITTADVNDIGNDKTYDIVTNPKTGETKTVVIPGHKHEKHHPGIAMIDEADLISMYGVSAPMPGAGSLMGQVRHLAPEIEDEMTKIVLNPSENTANQIFLQKLYRADGTLDKRGRYDRYGVVAEREAGSFPDLSKMNPTTGLKTGLQTSREVAVQSIAARTAANYLLRSPKIPAKIHVENHLLNKGLQVARSFKTLLLDVRKCENEILGLRDHTILIDRADSDFVLRTLKDGNERIGVFASDAHEARDKSIFETATSLTVKNGVVPGVDVEGRIPSTAGRYNYFQSRDEIVGVEIDTSFEGRQRLGIWDDQAEAAPADGHLVASTIAADPEKKSETTKTQIIRTRGDLNSAISDPDRRLGAPPIRIRSVTVLRYFTEKCDPSNWQHAFQDDFVYETAMEFANRRAQREKILSAALDKLAIETTKLVHKSHGGRSAVVGQKSQTDFFFKEIVGEIVSESDFSKFQTAIDKFAPALMLPQESAELVDQILEIADKIKNIEIAHAEWSTIHNDRVNRVVKNRVASGREADAGTADQDTSDPPNARETELLGLIEQLTTDIEASVGVFPDKGGRLSDVFVQVVRQIFGNSELKWSEKLKKHDFFIIGFVFLIFWAILRVFLIFFDIFESDYKEIVLRDMLKISS